MGRVVAQDDIGGTGHTFNEQNTLGRPSSNDADPTQMTGATSIL